MFPDCWDIEKGKLVQEFQNWGLLYKVEFEIMVTHPGSGWTNVFHFTADGDYFNDGDRIPSLLINSDRYFHFSSSVNGNPNYQQNAVFVLGKKYQMIIRQFKSNATYWYEIIIDGVSKLKIKNNQAKRFSSVKMYASDPWHNSFTSDLGSISHIRVLQNEG